VFNSCGEAAAARRGDNRSEEGEKSVAVSYIRRRVSVAAVKGQCHSFLGRLEVLGPVRRSRSRGGGGIGKHTMLLSERQGRSILRRGFAKLD
jgi:hypothetical protein